MWALGRTWYGDRLDYDWQPKTLEMARAAFAASGLTDPYWAR